MRITRQTIELMHEAIQDTAAEEFVLDLSAHGKLQFAAVETVERLRTLGLTKLKTRRKATDEERDALIVELRGQGLTLKEVGDRVGLSQERVRRIAERAVAGPA